MNSHTVTRDSTVWGSSSAPFGMASNVLNRRRTDFDFEIRTWQERLEAGEVEPYPKAETLREEQR